MSKIVKLFSLSILCICAIVISYLVVGEIRKRSNVREANDNFIQTEAVTVEPQDRCFSSARYFVVERRNDENVGSDVLVKYKKSPQTMFDCVYEKESGDFEIKNEGAVYFLLVTESYIVLDSGTAPEPRGLVVYDMNTRKKIFTDRYVRPVEANGNTLTYWSPVSDAVTTQNCARKNEYEMNGLGVVLTNKVTVDLVTLKKVTHGETKCIGVQ